MNSNASNPSSPSSLLTLGLVTHRVKVLRSQRMIIDTKLATLEPNWAVTSMNLDLGKFLGRAVSPEASL